MTVKPLAKTIGLQAVQDGLLNLGVKEDPPGSNWGRWIKVYLNFCGINYPAPWCAAFLSFRVWQAAIKLMQVPSWPKSASCQYIYDWAVKHRLVLTHPAAGMAFVLWFSSKQRYAHCGLITEVKEMPGGKLLFKTVEGNSNSTGSREGTEVASNWRTWGDKYKAIKII